MVPPGRDPKIMFTCRCTLIVTMVLDNLENEGVSFPATPERAVVVVIILHRAMIQSIPYRMPLSHDMDPVTRRYRRGRTIQIPMCSIHHVVHVLFHFHSTTRHHMHHCRTKPPMFDTSRFEDPHNPVRSSHNMAWEHHSTCLLLLLAVVVAVETLPRPPTAESHLLKESHCRLPKEPGNRQLWEAR